MNKAELKKMDAKTLYEKIATLKRELFDLKLSAASTPIKDNSQFKKLRANIARALTFLNSNTEQESPAKKVE
jgi:ribosomal protein L29